MAIIYPKNQPLHKKQFLTDTPSPVVLLNLEGTYKEDDRTRAVKESIKDLDKIEVLAWSFVVTKNRIYLDKALEFILAWANENKSDGNAINESFFAPLLRGYKLIYYNVSADNRNFIDLWLTEKARLLWEKPKYDGVNWRSHKLHIVGLIADVTNNQELFKKVITQTQDHIGRTKYKSTYEAKNGIVPWVPMFYPDGSSSDFKVHDALNYHTYALIPLLRLACVAKNHDISLFDYNSNGATLRKAVDFLIPYNDPSNVHMEYVNSVAPLDKKRAANNPNYIRPWRPQANFDVFNLASCLDSKYKKIALESINDTSKTYSSFDNLVFEVKAALDAKTYIRRFSCDEDNGEDCSQKSIKCYTSKDYPTATDHIVDMGANCRLGFVDWRSKESFNKEMDKVDLNTLRILKPNYGGDNYGGCSVGNLKINKGIASLNNINKSWSTLAYGCKNTDGSNCSIKGFILCKRR